MNKINFENYPNLNTPLSAQNLNLMQDNIDNAKEDKIITGSWTPEINTTEDIAPTITYDWKYGSFSRIGNLVFVQFSIRGKITALNATNNYATIKGLPYSVLQNGFGESAFNIGNYYDMIQSPANLTLTAIGYNIRVQNNYGSSAALLKITSGNYFEISGNGWYKANI